MKLNVMTYNIQHGHIHQSDPGRIDLTGVGDVIKKYNADIIGLNEVRGLGVHPEYTAQVEFLATYLGFHCYFGRSIYVGGHNPYGNAVLSRYPIVEAKVIRIPDPVDANMNRFEPRSITRAVIELPENDYSKKLAVFSSHFGLSPEEAEHAVSTAYTALRDEPLPFVLMGDFNVTPDNPVLAPLSLAADSNAELLEGIFSFPSHDANIRIDYMYTSRAISVHSMSIPDERASDHRPVIAELEI